MPPADGPRTGTAGAITAPLLRRRSFQVALLCLAAFATSAAVALNVFEAMPHLEDEHANYFQAQVFARGAVSAPAPLSRNSFFIPFVIVREGLWFGKYTPGFPLVLALGVLAGAPWLVNALASALALLGVYLLAGIFSARMPACSRPRSARSRPRSSSFPAPCSRTRSRWPRWSSSPGPSRWSRRKSRPG